VCVIAELISYYPSVVLAPSGELTAGPYPASKRTWYHPFFSGLEGSRFETDVYCSAVNGQSLSQYQAFQHIS